MLNKLTTLWTAKRFFLLHSMVITLLVIAIPLVILAPNISTLNTYLAVLLIVLSITYILKRLNTAFVRSITAFAQYISKKIDAPGLARLASPQIAEHVAVRDYLIKQQTPVTVPTHKALQDKIAQLETQLETKTTLLINASHEIRTPLQGVYNISQALDQQWGKYDDPKRQEMVHAMAESAERLNQFVDSLLDLSKIDAGKMLFDHQQLNMSSIVKEVVNEFIDTQLPDNNVVISYHIEHNHKFSTIGDNNKLKQLIRNLLSNAIKFTKQGKITVSLRNTDQQFMTVEVCDEGIGIPKEDIDHIFEPFVQSKLTQHMAGSTGLGLALCKEIVEGHNGKIWVKNNQSKGACFLFTLPYSKADEAPELYQNKSSSPSSSSSNSIKLLMVDDEEICHYSTKITLGNEPSISMLSAYNAEQGIELLKQNGDIDVILLDMMMPGVDGIEMLKMLKENPDTRHIAVIMQSGIANPQQIKHAIAVGAASFATKPTSREIINQIFEVLNK